MFRDFYRKIVSLEKLEFTSGPRILFRAERSLLLWNLAKFEPVDLEKFSYKLGISALVRSPVLEEVYWNIKAL